MTNKPEQYDVGELLSDVAELADAAAAQITNDDLRASLGWILGNVETHELSSTTRPALFTLGGVRHLGRHPGTTSKSSDGHECAKARDDVIAAALLEAADIRARAKVEADLKLAEAERVLAAAHGRAEQIVAAAEAHQDEALDRAARMISVARESAERILGGAESATKAAPLRFHAFSDDESVPVREECQGSAAIADLVSSVCIGERGHVVAGRAIADQEPRRPAVCERETLESLMVQRSSIDNAGTLVVSPRPRTTLASVWHASSDRLITDRVDHRALLLACRIPHSGSLMMILLGPIAAVAGDALASAVAMVQRQWARTPWRPIQPAADILDPRMRSQADGSVVPAGEQLRVEPVHRVVVVYAAQDIDLA